MISARIPENESVRLSALHEIGLLDSPQEAEFDEIVKFASMLCNTPISLISLVDSDRQWFKARIGLDVDETNRDVSFCSHAILQDQLFEIRDTILDNRFADNPLVVDDPSIRFYAGMPLVTSGGDRLGTLCVIDRTPGELSEKQRFGLKVLANNVIKIAELRIKNKELYYLTETQKRIISILAHDVRNPLASIKNILELKQSEILDAEDAAEMIKMVTGQLNNTIEMVENVVSWGQMHLKFGQLNLVDFDLHDLVGRIFGSETLNSVAKGNRLVNNIPYGTIEHSDERALEFILRNLVSNANKFTQNGSISIDIKRAGIKTILWISDTGVGMPQEKAVTLFSGDVTSTLGTNKEKGSGLGLLLVKEFVERLNGSIAVESQINRGTTIRIEL
ncbi:GAF domain-containing sensor histidine kinase [Mucilaginibacter flavidus]|uniref:GAF domain-containing sensor histidine kinase n=1 Tax=Mucilaginibacter flavidus TaxID=2949309 RepID=UPI002093665C|nr:GAF domain-containing sensor histidine kinase [Mucilaginibacter flavidus]MCO5951048.1 GAF domain-containing sensor histidine kinase [Mucilaginibacter flavidus]